MFNEKIVLANLILSYGNDAIINIEIVEDGKSTMYEMLRNSYIGNTINAIKSLKISDLIKFLENQEINKKW